jgi:hypothetical protein
MFPILLLFALCFLLCLNGWAGDWYVRSAAAGAASGKDWNNAWSLSGINWASVQPGDTVWLAGGAYSSTLSVGKSGTSGNPIKVYRAMASDTAPASAAGWSSAFDSLVTITGSPGISVPSSSYDTIDGRTNYGIKVIISNAGGDGAKIAQSGSVSNLNFRHIEIASTNPSNPSSGVYGFNFAPSVNTVSNVTMSYTYVHGICEALRASNWNNVVLEYSTIADLQTDSVDHDDVMYSYPSTNVTFRYNSITNSPSDGIFFEFGGADHFYFYGNYYWNSSTSLLTTKAPGPYGPMFIYNNVFQSAGPCSSNCGFITSNNVSLAAGSEVANNVFWYVANDMEGANSNHNAYNYTTLNGFSWPSGESGSFTFTGNPFVNLAGGDFHPLSGSTLAGKGKALATDGFLNKDRDGNTRGADGTWDIGAYEFSSGAPPPPPPPSGSVCDVNGDGTTNVVDVQQEVNQALALATCKGDINKDGQCTVIDVQRVVNAALGGQCVTP